LYSHSTLGVLQWCIPTEEDKALLLDVHEGVCGHHALARMERHFDKVFTC
jgi:hypothetical protein